MNAQQVFGQTLAFSDGNKAPKKQSTFWQLLTFTFLSLILRQQKILMKHNNYAQD